MSKKTVGRWGWFTQDETRIRSTSSSSVQVYCCTSAEFLAFSLQKSNTNPFHLHLISTFVYIISPYLTSCPSQEHSLKNAPCHRRERTKDSKLVRWSCLRVSPRRTRRTVPTGTTKEGGAAAGAKEHEPIYQRSPPKKRAAPSNKTRKWKSPGPCHPLP